MIYFPSAVTLGALHALEPGHAKTLTAAYLIGTKGTKRDAILLGLSVAFTHSLVVIALSVIAVLLGREAFTDEAGYVLAISSSVVVVTLGIWLLTKRLRALKRAKQLGSDSHHSHAPEPVAIKGQSFGGHIEIVETPNGERFRLKIDRELDGLKIEIHINRDNRQVELHRLVKSVESPMTFFSVDTPAEPHEFSAALIIQAADKTEKITFSVHEPHHHHDHSLLSDGEHARAHAANLPEYVHKGEKPSLWQIIAFGAAGGLVPCPAAVSVMLLSLSLSQSGKGLIMVLGFSIGLAITLVGVGLLIVTGISRLSSTGKLSRLSMLAPSIAAGMVIVSGTVGLITAIVKHG